MSGVEINGSLRKACGGVVCRRGQERQPAPPYRASWSTGNVYLIGLKDHLK